MAQDKLYRVWKTQYPKSKRRLVLLDETLDELVIGGFKPQAPFLDQDTKVVSIGSCFATEVAKSLKSHGIKVGNSFVSEGLSSAFALEHLFRYLIAGKPFPEGYLQDSEIFLKLDADITAQIATADLFVLTLGLSCVWFNRATGNQVLEPAKIWSNAGVIGAFDSFEMRQTSVDENETAILEIIGLIRSVNPSAAIVLTLSPIPLLAAFNETPPVAANIVSKAVLRAALHNICARNFPAVHYWPSYEYVMWYGSTVEIIYGKDSDDLRHISQTVIDGITARFKKFYFKSLPSPS